MNVRHFEIVRSSRLIYFNFPLGGRRAILVPGDPQKVAVVSVNSTSIRVEWKPPVEKEQYGIIRGYQIHVQEVDAKVPVLIKFSSGSTDLSNFDRLI